MSFSPDNFEALLRQVDRPGRYLGNERGVVRKDPRAVSLRFALAFPEVYEIAQSHPGLQILYDLLNRRAEVYAERAYAPWGDMEALLRRHGYPLPSLETCTPLAEFDIVGFSLQYELTYTNLLLMLDLGGIPLLARERRASDPLVIAGGPCAFNPEPLADFIDAFLLGDGEEAVGDICDAHLHWDGTDREELLLSLARIPGVYVPSFYAADYDEHGRLTGVRPTREGIPAVVEKRVLADLNSVPLPQTYVVPNMKVVHARPSLEVMRGCVKGCRFCQAGYIYRPLRERDPRNLLAQAENAVAATGTDELSLLSLSTGDYSCVNPLITELMNRYSGRNIAVSLPSTRVDALAPSLLDQIRRVRKTGFTLAPEAGTQRMRDVIQKEYREEELLDAARLIFGLGWRSLKLYFMLGLPGETEEDLRGIADLAAKVAATATRRVEVTASVSTFVPKPHTPFQWAAQIDSAEIAARQTLLRGELQRRRIQFKWQDASASYLEGIVARGDRRTGALLLAAYRLGARFDGWSETCRPDLWERAMAETGIRAQDYLGRRLLDAALPWDHIGAGVSKKFLQRELARAVEGTLTPDCSVERCTYCGACDFKRIRNVDYHVAGAKGADHRGGLVDNWARLTVGGDDTPGSWEPRGWQKIRQRQSAGKGRPPASAPARRAEPWADGEPARIAAPGQPGTPPANSAARGLGAADQWISAPREGLGPIHPSAPALVRVRVAYSKLGRAAFISHLELIEVFASALSRAELPVAFSQGHRPAPRLRFSPGLPVGVESDCEFLDVDLTRSVPAPAVASALGAQLPEGLRVVDARMIPINAPSIEISLAGFRFRVLLAGLVPEDRVPDVERRFAALIAASRFPMWKSSGGGDREIDARPLVARIALVGDRCAEIDLAFNRDGSVKPSELLAAVLDLDRGACRSLPIRKVRCFFHDAGAKPAERPLPFATPA